MITSFIRTRAAKAFARQIYGEMAIAAMQGSVLYISVEEAVEISGCNPKDMRKVLDRLSEAGLTRKELKGGYSINIHAPFAQTTTQREFNKVLKQLVNTADWSRF